MADRPRALITGAATRVGRAIALDLASTGWDVVIHYNGSSAEAEETASEARAKGARAATIAADLLDEAQVETLIARSAEALGGPLSLLVNNASIFEAETIETMTRTSWDRAIESNLRAPVKLTQDFAAQAPRKLPDARGEPVAQSVVINLIDQRVLKPTPMFFSYFIAKSGLYAFTRSAAQALAPDIRFAAIGPGPTLAATEQSDEHFYRQRAACLLERGSDPEDICTGVQFILKNKAFTGQMLAIDGGQHLNWRTPDVIGTGE